MKAMRVNAEEDNGFWVEDVESGETIQGVIEADTDEGWMRIVPYGQVFNRPKGFKLVEISTREEVARTGPDLSKVDIRVSFDLNAGDDVFVGEFRVVDAQTGEVIPYLTAADTHAGTITVLQGKENERGFFTPDFDEDGAPILSTVYDRPFHIVALRPENMRCVVLAESAHCQEAKKSQEVAA